MRRSMILILVLLCGMAWVPPAGAYKGTVTIAVRGETPTMDPHVTLSYVGTMAWRWAYDSLLNSLPGTGKVVPWLAEKWERLGPTKFKFWLRKGLKFTDGTPVTSEAVKFSFSRILDPANMSRQRSYWTAFDRIETIDDNVD